MVLAKPTEPMVSTHGFPIPKDKTKEARIEVLKAIKILLSKEEKTRTTFDRL